MLRGGRRGRRCQSRRREPADGKGRAEPGRAEPGVTLRMSGNEKGIAPFLRHGAAAGLRAAPARPGARWPRGSARRGALRERVPPAAPAVRAGSPGNPSPGPPEPRIARRRWSVPFADKNINKIKFKSAENGKQAAGHKASPCAARRESPRCRQHLPGSGAAVPGPRRCPGEALLTARHRPLAEPPRPPGPSSASARGQAAHPPRRARPRAPVPGPAPVPVPVPPSGGRSEVPGDLPPTGRAEPWGAPVATAAPGLA